MARQKLGKRKCEYCGILFQKTKPLQPVCSMECAIKLSREQIKKKREKAERDEIKEMKDSLLTHSDWLKVLQKVVNAFIRLRDKGKPCISCGIHADHMQAGHLFSVGHYPNLRFHEDNIHLQCRQCNLYEHGKTAEFMIALPKRIGELRFQRMIEFKNVPLKISIPEIKEQIEIYKNKIKQLKDDKSIKN